MEYKYLHSKNIVAFLVLTLLNLSFSVQAQTVQLNYTGKNDSIISVVKQANIVLNDLNFYKKIDSIQSFDNSDYSGEKISFEIKNLNQIIQIKSYWNPFGFANAKTVSVIKLNTAKLKRSQKSILNTLIHETVHAVDWKTNNKWDYTHDGNSPNGQNDTAPWVIGKIAADLTY